MPRRILVVDDDEDISLMLKDRLTSMGFDVCTASNGSEGMALLKRMEIDGILLDIQMPVMDGLTMLKHVRIEYPLVRIIVMSAELKLKEMIQGIERGASDYILKPVDFDVLEKKCSMIFS